MFEIDQVYQDKFIKFEVSLLVYLTKEKEVNIDPFDFRVIFGDPNILGMRYLTLFLLLILALLMHTLIAILN